MVLHYSPGEIDTGVVTARMKYLKPDTPIILLFGSADEPAEVPVVDVFMRKLESPNILLAKLSEVLYSNHSSAARKQQKAKPMEANWVA